MWNRITPLLEQHQIKLHQVESDNFVGDYQWDGKTIIASRGDNLLHDFAHYQCAHPNRRFLPDFGLGTGPDSFETSSKAPGVTVAWAEFEESCASILGILWEIKLGFPFAYTLEYHQWYKDTDATKNLEWLQRHQLVVDGEPVMQNLRVI